MSNPVTQFQIVSTAPAETARFYAALFGWAVTADNALGYRQIATGSPAGIQGGIWPAPPQASTFAQLFITVDDIDATLREAERLGAKAIIPVTTLPGGDQMAVLLDPQGMSFGVWRSGHLGGGTSIG